MRRYFNAFAVVFAAVLFSSLSSFNASFGADGKEDKPVFDAIAASQADDDKYEWTYLFDGKSMKNWIDLKDGGDYAVQLKDGCLVLGMGPTTTSIKFDDENSGIKIPTENYEIEYVAKRDAGTDFFAAMTFPIGDKFVTFVNGGWGGFVAGISSIDDMDASENSTSSFYNFKTAQWYRFRVQVTKRTLCVWVNDEKIVDYVVEGHSLKTRFEVSACQPLGFASWVSAGVIKTIRLRALSEEEIKEMNKRAEDSARFFSN